MLANVLRELATIRSTAEEEAASCILTSTEGLLTTATTVPR
jgi:hypothetical protein